MSWRRNLRCVDITLVFLRKCAVSSSITYTTYQPINTHKLLSQINRINRYSI